jgi:hypothetical protein
MSENSSGAERRILKIVMNVGFLVATVIPHIVKPTVQGARRKQYPECWRMLDDNNNIY